MKHWRHVLMHHSCFFFWHLDQSSVIIQHEQSESAKFKCKNPSNSMNKHLQQKIMVPLLSIQVVHSNQHSLPCCLENARQLIRSFNLLRHISQQCTCLLKILKHSFRERSQQSQSRSHLRFWQKLATEQSRKAICLLFYCHDPRLMGTLIWVKKLTTGLRTSPELRHSAISSTDEICTAAIAVPHQHKKALPALALIHLFRPVTVQQPFSMFERGQTFFEHSSMNNKCD